jgi:hypothetical protein
VRAFNDTDHGGRDRVGRWHAQAGQDRTVAALLRRQRGGFFLDLAANEPVVLSNTRTLERDFGFKGICIEVKPRSPARARLKKNKTKACARDEAWILERC